MDRRVLLTGLLGILVAAPASAHVMTQAPILEEARVETEEVRRGGRGRPSWGRRGGRGKHRGWGRGRGRGRWF